MCKLSGGNNAAMLLEIDGIAHYGTRQQDIRAMPQIRAFQDQRISRKMRIPSGNTIVGRWKCCGCMLYVDVEEMKQY